MSQSIFKIVKKLFRALGITVLAVLILANVFILLSGRFYLYKGIANTYLKGETGPGIYDLDVFPHSAIKASSEPFIWPKTANFNSYKLTDEEKALFDKTGTSAFLVYHNDSLVYEYFDGTHKPQTVSNSFSAAKTVVSFLIGIALQEGKIKSLDEPVGNYLPAFKSEDKKNITIRHLLQMASGLDWQESGKNPLSENAESYYGKDLYGLVNRQIRITQPGKVFKYQSGNSQLLGFIIEKATGKSVSAYAEEKLWTQIGTTSQAYWSLDKEGGDEKSFCCLYGTAHDFAKLGRLMLNKGSWGGNDILPKSYVDEMFKPADLITEDGLKNQCYGLHVWLYNDFGDDVIYCRGILGQYITAIPSRNIVFVRLGHRREKNVTYEDAIRNTEWNESMIDHPMDLFTYLKMVKKMTN